MTIHVTSEDIAQGQAARCRTCPVALAAQRAGCERPIVYGTHMSVVVGFARKWFQLPPDARQFVEQFDATREGEPFSFEIAHESEAA